MAHPARRNIAHLSAAERQAYIVRGLGGTDDQPGRGAQVLGGLHHPDHLLLEVHVAAPQTRGLSDS